MHILCQNVEIFEKKDTFSNTFIHLKILNFITILELRLRWRVIVFEFSGRSSPSRKNPGGASHRELKMLNLTSFEVRWSAQPLIFREIYHFWQFIRAILV